MFWKNKKKNNLVINDAYMSITRPECHKGITDLLMFVEGEINQVPQINVC